MIVHNLEDSGYFVGLNVVVINESIPIPCLVTQSSLELESLLHSISGIGVSLLLDCGLVSFIAGWKKVYVLSPGNKYTLERYSGVPE
jgi:hypothetical protein